MAFFINLSLLKRNSKFRWLFVGRSVSLIGTMITNVALPYQIYHLTHSTFMVGILSLIQLIPLIFTALYGGVLADKHNRRKMIIIAELFLMFFTLLLWWNATRLQPDIWLIFFIAALISSTVGLHRPAFDSLQQQLIEKKDFAEAGAIKTMIRNICLIAGPALAGWLIAHFTLPSAYFVDFVSFITSLFSLVLIGHVPKPKQDVANKTFLALKEGLRYSISRQDLLGSYLVDFFAMVFGMPQALFPAIAFHHGGAYTFGLLYSAPAAGAVVISIFSGWVARIKRYCAAIAISASLWGAAIILFGITLVHELWLSLLFLSLAGAADGISGIFRSILWNETIPQNMRGRLVGIEMISYLSGPKLGDTETGFVASMFGVTTAIVSGGILCIVAVTGCCYYLPKFWKYRSVELSVLSEDSLPSNPTTQPQASEIAS